MRAKKKKTTAISNRPLSLAPFGTLYWVGEYKLLIVLNLVLCKSAFKSVIMRISLVDK